MKPISLRFQAFGPYLDAQTIDFSALEKSGLFLIAGETGSGKTTILDAICCALYGEASGKNRGDLEAMRCKQADRSQETLVEYVFETNGRRYKFVRRLRFGHKNMLDEHNCMEYRDGVYVPLFENPKKTRVNEKAGELIGLTAEQFRQVIVLPQGKFETLLVSDSGEKEQILTSIFHVDRWDAIERYLGDALAQEKRELETLELSIRQALALHGCESVQQLPEKLAQTETQLQKLQAQAKTLGQRQQQLAAQVTQAALDDEAFAQLDAAQQKLQALSAQKDDVQKRRASLSDAQRAQTVRAEYDELCAAVRDAEKQQQAFTAAQQRQQVAERQLLLTQEKQEKNAQEKQKIDGHRSAVQRLCDARDAYAAVEKTAASVVEAQRQTDAAERKLQDRQARLQTAKQTLLACADALNAADEACRQARERYMRSVSGILAETALEDGKPCPVCGSTHHPAPAKPAQDGITQQEMERLESQRDAKRDAFDAAGRQREQIAKEVDTAKQAQTQALLVLQQARSDDAHARSRLIDGVQTAQQLEQEIARLQTQINLYEKEETQLREALQRAQAEETAKRQLAAHTREVLEQARHTLALREQAWQTALTDAGFADTQAFVAAFRPPEQMQRTAREIAQYEAALEATEHLVAQQKQKVSGKTRPDLQQLQDQRLEVEEQWNRASQDAAVLADTCEKLRADCARLQQQATQAAQQRAQYEDDAVFYRRIVGSTGMSLKRYVLGVMLTSVTEQANEMLRTVYGGRYCLYRTDASTGGARRSGLELEVLDRQGNVRRSVKTLSGGEKFLVALSLAIGLSTVVQSQNGGVRLDAMFIDEGFGTLDRRTIGDALEILQGVRRQNGIVGVISHVEALRESIPAQIEVRKGRDGSCLFVHGV